MTTIELFKVSEEIYFQKGFDEIGCYGSSCQDACCRFGSDVDKESYELICQNRDLIEKKLGFSLEECFTKEWSNQADFLGGNSISTTVINGSCAFHVSASRGCVLFQLVMQENYPKRMIPSTCRLYPLTWDHGIMRVVDSVEKCCNCLDPFNKSIRALWETQKEAIEDIFTIVPK